MVARVAVERETVTQMHRIHQVAPVQLLETREVQEPPREEQRTV